MKDILGRGDFAEGLVDGRGIGVFETDLTLACKGRPGYWAVGDNAGVPDPITGGLCPPTAQYAIREAKACAQNIIAAIDRQPLREFRCRKLVLSVAFLGNISSCLPEEPQVVLQPVQPIAVREELLVLRPKVTCLNPEKIDYSVAELIIALRCANENKLTAEEKEEALQMILRERNRLYHRPLK